MAGTRSFHDMCGMVFRGAGLLIIVAIFLSSCQSEMAGEDSSTSTSSGIKGAMVIGPVCPGPTRIPLDPKCTDRPYHGRLAIKSGSSRQTIAIVTPNQAGEFKVTVSPGRYFVTWLAPQRDGRRFQSQVIEVRRNRVTSVRLRFDTGMR
jgi:hypothetical protein